MGENHAIAPKGKHTGLSGAWLKMLAIVTMTIDHTAAVLLYDALSHRGVSFVTELNFDTWYTIYMIMRLIGRMAFPIYCFLLVEGFDHTRNAGKYAKRLFVFALVSEIPFDLALNHVTLEFSYNNVFFTLFLGLLTIMGISLVQKHIVVTAENSLARGMQYFLRVAAALAVILCGMAAADFLFHTDYGASGVAAIVAMYLFRRKPIEGFALAVVILGVFSDESEFAALLMMIPIHFYNGTRGRQMKYLFYAYYPIHLLILAYISHSLGIGF